LHARGTTVLLITHDPAIAAQADRHVRIEDGVLTGSRSAPTPSAAAGPGSRGVAAKEARPPSPPASGHRASALLDDAEAVLDLLIADDEDNPGLQ
ncbi:hypothetical protein FPK48_24260, partial [Acinetobacter baumannii]|nr:hypothetical protein [Acinetobacter baumannii]